MTFKYSSQSIKNQKDTIASPKTVEVEEPPAQSLDTQTQLAFTPIPTVPCTFIEDGAACFFFNDYVLDNSVVSSSIFCSLPKYYAQAPADSALSNTIVALGMVCLSNTNRAPELMTIAAPKYAAALKSINAAIRDPVKAQSDQLLLIVMLMALYEEVRILTMRVL